MTDRLKGAVVVFESDVREDDAEHLLNAIRQLRGVISVLPSVTTPDDYINRERVRQDLSRKLFTVLDWKK